MSNFSRNMSNTWQLEVPGTRWFRADLHIHTLDDHPNCNLRRPHGVSGEPSNPDTQQSYARAFLKAAVANRIQVLGLTPHSLRSGAGLATSATWAIVDEWNNGNDSDGIPFRDKIFAVFPGFEPSLSDGAEGIHLIFLFDPEIGCAQLLRAFDVVMNGVEPYLGGSLRNTTHNSAAVFERLSKLRTSCNDDWNYLCIAPHAFSDRGLFKLKSQILKEFPHAELAAIELGDNQLPEDAYSGRDWLADGMRKYRHCFFHSSDAYDVSLIGHRFTLLKLGSPRLESLRQAFLAHDSRVQLAYSRTDTGEFAARSDLPDPLALGRPWLRRVCISGGTSFFRNSRNVTPDVAIETFNFSPDLTCIIGGRMSGKSTLLDGLRVRVGLTLPADLEVRKEVEGRARERFLSGGANCALDLCGPIASTDSDMVRWPAKFYTQRELQRAVKDQHARRQLLYRLLPETSDELVQLDSEITSLDGELATNVLELERLRGEYQAAEEMFRGVSRARDALALFRDAGSEELASAQAEEGRIAAIKKELARQSTSLSSVIETSRALSIPFTEQPDLVETLASHEGPVAAKLLQRYKASLRLARLVAARLDRVLSNAEAKARAFVAAKKNEVQTRVVAAGGTAEQLNQLDALTASAAEFETRAAALSLARRLYWSSLKSFFRRRAKRTEKIARRRVLMSQLSEHVAARFSGKIRLVIVEGGVFDTLDEWIRHLRMKGVTQWWNERQMSTPVVTPETIRSALRQYRRAGRTRSEAGRCFATLSMSPTVTNSFATAIDDDKLTRLSALRNEDRYEIEMRIHEDPPIHREMDKLSGGAQVSVLLSLILEANDSTPLVIDQPEDEIDKEFLFETILPALRRLKGRRQVIFATHDANIVVNGDADQVIQLKAQADIGRAEVQGVIEIDEVRDAILATLDGGRDAFTLRLAKYGF